MMNLYQYLNAEQVVNVPTCSRIIIDVVYTHNVCAEAYVGTFNGKPIDERNYGFGSADYSATYPFQPVCHTSVNRLNTEYKVYCKSVIDKFGPRRTRN